MKRHKSNCGCLACVKRREYQSTVKLSIGVIEYTCGCGSYLGQSGDEPAACSDCIIKGKTIAKLKLARQDGFCIYCGDLAPGICRTCAYQIKRGK